MIICKINHADYIVIQITITKVWFFIRYKEDGLYRYNQNKYSRIASSVTQKGLLNPYYNNPDALTEIQPLGAL